MKTEKQIQLLSLEMGEKYYKDIDDLDVISIGEHWNDFDIIVNETTLTVPLIPHGVFEKINIDQTTDYLIFNAELEENKIEMYATILKKDNNDRLWWVCDFCCHFPCEVKEEICSNIDAYSDPSTMIFLKQKYQDEKIENYIEKNVSEKLELFLFFQKISAWLNYLMAHPERKNISVQKKKHSNATREKKAEHKTVSYNNIIFLNNIKFKTSNKKLASNLRSKKINRVASSWSVRGHFRKYKNGKVIYINSYEKGKNKEKRIKKKYQI